MAQANDDEQRWYDQLKQTCREAFSAPRRQMTKAEYRAEADRLRTVLADRVHSDSGALQAEDRAR